MTSSPESSPPRLVPEKRPNPTSSPSDLNQAKKAKPDSTDLGYSDELLAGLYLTPEDRNLPPDEFWDKSMPNFAKAMKEECPPCPELIPKVPDDLPPGYAYGSVVPGSGVNSYVFKMICLFCGGAHLEKNCDKKDTPEAEEYARQNFPFLDEMFGDLRKPKTK